MKGDRWVAWDVHFLDKPFGMALLDRFGPAGVVAFLGFICACKDGDPPGRVTYANESDGLAKVFGPGFRTVALVDPRGEPWGLDDLWKFTGPRFKQTRITVEGRLKHVTSTHWERWQKERARLLNAERQRRWRGKKDQPSSVTQGVTGSVTQPLPTSTATSTYRDFVENGQNPEEELVDLRAAVAVLKEQMGWGQGG